MLIDVIDLSNHPVEHSTSYRPSCKILFIIYFYYQRTFPYFTVDFKMLKQGINCSIYIFPSHISFLYTLTSVKQVLIKKGYTYG